jgi:N-acetylneuraminic acid mutarotase
MIIWGGQNGTTRFNDGGRYDPAADSWMTVTTVSAPGLRDHHTAVWTGTEMIVWGGWNGTGNYYNDGGRYNPLTDTWTAVSTYGAPTPRYYHSAIWTGREMIVWGGYTGPSGYFNDGGRYNPTTDTWTALPTTAAPALSISPSGPDSAVLSWASPAVGHWLEQNADLRTTNWTGAGLAATDDGTTKRVSVSLNAPKNFYRLK